MAVASSISRLWNAICRSGCVPYPAFAIPPANVVGSQSTAAGFRADQAYFELRICEQFLRDRREYWNEYNPMTIVLSEFIYNGVRQSFPFVVGPALLKGLEELEGDERVHYRNTRVLGPAPYRGDDVAIFVGLFRVKMRDWARQALTLLESVARAFDSSRLTTYLAISGPLMAGIESFLEMGDQMQFRLGQRDVFADPEIESENVFAPGHYAIIRDGESAVNRGQFWVKEDRLYVGETASQLRPYLEQDYVLYQIVHLDKRNDYTTFDFHRQWEDVQRQIWSGNEAKAIEGYRHLIGLIRRSPDLIPSHMSQLAAFYRARYQEEAEAYKKSLDPTISLAEIGESAFSKSLERLACSNTDEEAIQTITRSRDFLLERAGIRSQMDGPVHLAEGDIHAALDSRPLNDPAVKLVDPDKLAAALNLETPTL